MKISSFDNQEIEITAVYFRNKSTDHRLESYPRRMVYKGREYSFIEEGWQYLVKSGQQFIKLFDVSDGETQYRLRQDATNHWTLVGTKVGA
jgi:hypothetical protein